MILQHIIAFIALSTPALAEPLVTVLEKNGLSEFARQAQGDGPTLDGKNDLIVYAPTDAALGASASSNGSGPLIPVINGRATPQEIETSRLLMHYCTRTPPPPRPPPANKPSQNHTRSVRGVLSGGSALVSLLDNPEFSNLGPGNNQVVVQRTEASQPLVFSGMGQSAQVIGDDIPFDQGVIRPINGFLTLPENISTTLPLLNGISKFQNFLQDSGLLSELETRAGITILSPVDSAFPDSNNNGTSGGNSNSTSSASAKRTEMLRRHILVDFPAYTPLLRDGDVYPTLAGGSVTVSVRDGVVYLNGARIVQGDSMTKNGLIHVIDKVRCSLSAAAFFFPFRLPRILHYTNEINLFRKQKQVLDTSSVPSPPPPPYTGAAAVMGLPSWKAIVCSFAFVAGVARLVGLVL